MGGGGEGEWCQKSDKASCLESTKQPVKSESLCLWGEAALGQSSTLDEKSSNWDPLGTWHLGYSEVSKVGNKPRLCFEDLKVT